jgi:hypothetical protein
MRDLRAISLNVDACVLRARISALRPLERQLRQVVKALASVSATSARWDDPGDVVRKVELVQTLVTAAKRANAAGDATLGADIHRAARDLRAWYRLEDLTS